MKAISKFNWSLVQNVHDSKIYIATFHIDDRYFILRGKVLFVNL